MDCSSDSTSLNEWIQFQSSDGTAFEYKTEGAFVIDCNYLNEIRMYLPALPMHHSTPFNRSIQIDQFRGHQFKLGKSKK